MVVPNPAAERVTLNVELGQQSTPHLRIVDPLGVPVIDLSLEQRAAGEHHIPVDVSALVEGIYFYEVTAGGEARRGSILVLR